MPQSHLWDSEIPQVSWSTYSNQLLSTHWYNETASHVLIETNRMPHLLSHTQHGLHSWNALLPVSMFLHLPWVCSFSGAILHLAGKGFHSIWSNTVISFHWCPSCKIHLLEHSLKQHPEDTRTIQFPPYQEWLPPLRTNFLALQNLSQVGTSSLMPSPLLDYDQLLQLVGLPYTQWVSMEPILVAFSTTDLMQWCTYIDFYMQKPLTGWCVCSPQSRKSSGCGEWPVLPSLLFPPSSLWPSAGTEVGYKWPYISPFQEVLAFVAEFLLCCSYLVEGKMCFQWGMSIISLPNYQADSVYPLLSRYHILFPYTYGLQPLHQQTPITLLLLWSTVVDFLEFSL